MWNKYTAGVTVVTLFFLMVFTFTLEIDNIYRPPDDIVQGRVTGILYKGGHENGDYTFTCRLDNGKIFQLSYVGPKIVHLGDNLIIRRRKRLFVYRAITFMVVGDKTQKVFKSQ